MLDEWYFSRDENTGFLKNTYDLLVSKNGVYLIHVGYTQSIDEQYIITTTYASNPNISNKYEIYFAFEEAFKRGIKTFRDPVPLFKKNPNFMKL